MITYCVCVCVCVCVRACVRACVPDLYFELYDRLSRRLVPSVCLFRVYQFSIFYFPTIGNNNMVDARTSEKETKLECLIFRL